MIKLTRDFYLRDTITVARELIGKILFCRSEEGIASGRIVETEAYLGEKDRAAHSYKNSPSGRTNIQYGPGGFAYIYLIYGMYNCVNVVTGDEGIPECVLIRALEPVDGIGIMEKRRKTDKLLNLCSGPGKLCMALGIDRTLYGEDLCGDKLCICDDGYKRPEILATPRINIQYAHGYVDKPWRFIIPDSKFISVKPGKIRP